MQYTTNIKNEIIDRFKKNIDIPNKIAQIGHI